MLLSNFHSIRPPFETDQATGLDWSVEAHTEAERTKGLSDEDLKLFSKTLREKLWHVGCKPEWIEKRGHLLRDFLHRDWEKMEVYCFKEAPEGHNLSVRSRIYADAVDEIFEQYYPEKSSPPDDLIHVSCTGYVSPSGAQKITSKRGWGQLTTVTHAYHMGCYGSIPAIRMAMGFLHLKKGRTDVVHTEICTLHMNPSSHQTDQLVSQSLFADGFIKYSVTKKSKESHFQILGVQEEIIPDSISSMSWNIANWGFEMSLAKEIPVLISRTLKESLGRLTQRAKLSIEKVLKEAIFAIHPGGPKILFYIKDLLGLSDQQMAHSFEIFKKFGNMSSATLPHIWEAILRDKSVPSQTVIVSLAFGPGLSIAGILLEKQECGS